MLIIMGGRAEQQVSSIKQSKWRTVGIKVTKDDLFDLNQKLDLNGFKTLNEFVHTWIKEGYHAHENNEQVERLMNRIRDKGIRDPLTGE